MPALFAWSLGPVQDWIRTARKGKDLWFGSALLSDLSGTALRVLEGHGTLVTPPDTTADPVPNHLLAVVTGDPTAIGEELRAAVMARLATLTRLTFDQVQRRLDGHRALLGLKRRPFQREQAERQVMDLPELTWAATPLPEDPAAFSQARARVEALLSARKATRDFQAPTWGGTAYKSRLDGARESVLDRDLVHLTDEALLHRAAGISKGEFLCGPGLLKRHGRAALHGEGGGRIDSSSHFAARAWLDRIPPERRDGLASAVDEYVESIRGACGEAASQVLADLKAYDPDRVTGHLDGHALYRNRLPDFIPRAQLPGVERALDKLLRKLRAAMPAGAPPEPGGYYALLFADGDHVGEAFRTLHTQAEHAALAAQLQAFAKAAAGIVSDHRGGLIYAGGDDLSALVPVDRAFACGRALHAAMECLVTMRRITISLGIAVAHHLWPLQDALALARDAEKLAKGDHLSTPRDAWAIVLQPRGGPPRQARGPWTAAVTVEAMLAAWTAGGLPGGLPHELVDSARALPPKDADPPDAGPMHQAEARRVIARKRVDGAPIDDSLSGALLNSVELAGLRWTADLLVITRALSTAGAEA